MVAGQVQQHHEPGGPLDQGADRGVRSRRPMIRSPSQCPGTARSSTSAGRSLIVDHVRDPAPDARAAPACARFAQRPPGAQVLRSAPVAARRGPGRRATGRSSRATPTSPARRGSPRAAAGRSARGCGSSSSRVCTSRRSRRLRGQLGRPGPAAPGAHRPAPARRRPDTARAGQRLRRSSRLIVLGSRPSCRAIARTPVPAARRQAISSRSAKESRKPPGSLTIEGITPPALTNQPCAVRLPTPTATPASAAERPPRTAFQNSRCTHNRNHRTPHNNTSQHQVLRPPLELTCVFLRAEVSVLALSLPV